MVVGPKVLTLEALEVAPFLRLQKITFIYDYTGMDKESSRPLPKSHQPKAKSTFMLASLSDVYHLQRMT